VPHPVGLGELQVGDSRRRLQRHLPALGEPLLVEAGKPEKAVLAPCGNRGRRAVGPEKIADVEFIERDQPRHQARHFRMSGQRAMLGPRQGQSRPQFGKDRRGADHRGTGKRENRKRRIHVVKRYPAELTDS